MFLDDNISEDDNPRGRPLLINTFNRLAGSGQNQRHGCHDFFRRYNGFRFRPHLEVPQFRAFEV